MIGGSSIGSGNIGSFHVDNLVFGVRSAGVGLSGVESSPLYSFDISPPALGVSGGSASWTVLSFTVPPAIGLGANELEAEVFGSIDFDVNPAGLGLGVATIESDAILQGVPDFTITRSGVTVTINVSNREDRTIRVFRSGGHNTAFSELTTFATDQYVDTVPSATVNYKYKLAFTINLTPPLIARRSISKFTKS